MASIAVPAPQTPRSDLERRLRDAVRGEVLFDRASRGRYSTDASIYQVEPVGVLVPSSHDDVRAAFAICRELGVPMLPRGAGSSQCGQTVGACLVVDHSKHLNRVLGYDAKAATVVVEPGVVLDALNAWLKPHGLWFPVDVSTSAQATLGGMAGNNSCGSRSITGRNEGLPKASSIIVRSTSSIADGPSCTRCRVQSIAWRSEEKLTTPSARCCGSGASCSVNERVQASVPSLPTSRCARLTLPSRV